MKHIQKLGLYCAVLLALSMTTLANGGSSGNDSYKAIATRNVFALNPVSQTQPASKPPVLLANICVTGLMTILGSPDVLFIAFNPTDPKRPEKFYTLREGQAQDGIEVMSIDTKKEQVLFKNHGIIQAISLADCSTTATP